jgi:hypothetical protein
MIDRPVHSLIGVLALLGVAVPFAAMAAPQAPPPIRSTMPRATAAKPTAFNGAEPGDDKIKIKLSEDGKVIFVAGEFVAGSYRKFARILKSAPAVRTVHLGSPGGIVLEGFLMSALVRERKLNTYVETACSSSCTQVLVAGVDRAAAPRAKVGFHASAFVDEDEAEEANPSPFKAKDSNPASEKSGEKKPAENLAQIARKPVVPDENDDLVFKLSFIRSGVKQSFITRAFTTPHEDIWYPSITEMIEAHVLTRLSSGREIKVAPGIGIARDVIETALLKKSLWQSAKVLRPDLYEASVVDAIESSQTGSTQAEALRVADTALEDRLFPAIDNASVDIVDGFAVLSFDQMTADPTRYFDSCGRLAGVKPDAKPRETPELDQRVDALLIRLMQSKTRVKPMNYAKSARIVTKLLPSQSEAESASPDDQICRDSKALITAISNLPSKKRAEAYRALLVYGGAEDQEAAR